MLVWPVLCGWARFVGEPARQFQPVERRIQGALLDPEDVLAPTLDGDGNCITVHGSASQHPQNQHAEGTLHEFAATSLFWHRPSLPRRIILENDSGRRGAAS